MRVVYTDDLLQVDDWQYQWRLFAEAHDLPSSESDHWNWASKAAHIGQDCEFLIAALVDEQDARCHGLMKLIWPKPSRDAPGRDTLYLDYLEIAPWNQWNYGYDREYVGLGRALVRHAAYISDLLGYDGRVTLCSLLQSEAFYRRIPMLEIGTGEGNDAAMAFFELEQAVAQHLISEFM